MKMITWWMAGLVGATLAWFIWKQRAFSDAANGTTPGSDAMIGRRWRQ